MTANDIGILTRVLAPFLREDRARLTALEAKIAALEQRPMQKSSGVWHGVFDETRSYPEAALVTHNGGLWLSTRTTAGTRPGDSSGAFVLIVKRGAFDRGGR